VRHVYRIQRGYPEQYNALAVYTTTPTPSVVEAADLAVPHVLGLRTERINEVLMKIWWNLPCTEELYTYDEEG